MRPLTAVLEVFPLSRESGLSLLQVAQSRTQFGANTLTPLPRQPAWVKFLEKFDEPIIKILLAASLLKIVVDLFEASALLGGIALLTVGLLLTVALISRLGRWVPSLLFAQAVAGVLTSVVVGNPSFEGLAVMLAVLLATGVSFLSEFRSDKEFDKLNAARDSVRVKVERGGAVRTVPLEDVVVGDLVILETGDEVPADGRVVMANELRVDQSLVTGESEPVWKSPGRTDEASHGPESPGCLYRGTQVADGIGRFVVTSVGDDTMIGTIARQLSGDSGGTAESASSRGRVQSKLTITKSSTPLQEKLEVLAGLISRIGYGAAVAIFVALLVHGIWTGAVRWPGGEDAGAVLLASVKALLGYFVYMVIIIVVAVPEGLPMSVTISLAIAWRKMSKANSLVRQLVACETIGSATVICTDKTGTLTQNRMAVTRVALGGQVYESNLRDSGQCRDGAAVSGSPLFWLILNAAINSTATLERKGDKVVIVGNSTEGALLTWLDAGAWMNPGQAIRHLDLRAQHPVLHQVHFSSEHKRMTTVVKVGGRTVSLVKGAPEVILSRCNRYLANDGSHQVLDDAARKAILDQITTAAGDAMRTLAFAHAHAPEGSSLEIESVPLKSRDTVVIKTVGAAVRDRLEQGLVFTGFVAIRDPLREDVKEAVANCRRAGIEVKMITGDTIETASAIGREIGLLDSKEALALTSSEFNAMTDSELLEQVTNIRILARALPRDKYRLVGALQELHHVVAMTGDGTNDAPALKRADVGLAMGISGTEVAKEASKIVLLDDSFNTIVRAVLWGRALYENIQRFVQFQLTINASALVIAFLGPFLNLAKPPFTVLQLLWINVIMDTFAAIALCSEPPRENLMRRPPKHRDENIVTRAMLGTICSTAVFFVVTMMGLLLGMQHLGWFSDGQAHAALTLRQGTIFFTAYVLFQVWNQINCRSLSPDESGFHRLFENRQFLTVALLTVAGQVLIVTFGGEQVFNVEPLGPVDWLAIAAATSSVLLFAELTRRLRRVRPIVAATS